jgi:hypothetical protein
VREGQLESQARPFTTAWWWGPIFDPRRRGLAREPGRLLLANSDVSGLSIFEEAQFRGVEAAGKIIHRLGHA